MGRALRLATMGVPLGGGAAFGYGPGTGTKGVIYGVSWTKVASPTLTRTDTSASYTAQAGVDASSVTNDFDSAEWWSSITEVTDGDGNVFVRIPKCYIEKTDTANLKTWRISARGGGNSYLPKCFVNPAGGTYDYIDVGKYPGSVSGGKLQSMAGEYPAININIVDMRTYAQANGAGYQQLDIHVADLLQTMMYIEFATLNLQTIMAGYTTGQYNAAHTLTADTNPAGNTLVVTNAVGALYEAGQAISVGTSLGGNQRFYGRAITNIQADTPGAGSTTITFDGAAVALTTGDILYNTGYKNADGITATSGSIASNSSGKHYCKYRGVVSPYGNIWQFVDGININDGQAWVCPDASQYASNLFAAPYEQLGYVNANANGYVSAMGWDADHPYAALPVTVAGGSTTYYSDYYYQSSGQQIALLGAHWFLGSAAGPACWSLGTSSSNAHLSIGGRLVRKGG